MSGHLVGLAWQAAPVGPAHHSRFMGFACLCVIAGLWDLRVIPGQWDPHGRSARWGLHVIAGRWDPHVIAGGGTCMLGRLVGPTCHIGSVGDPYVIAGRWDLHVSYVGQRDSFQVFQREGRSVSRTRPWGPDLVVRLKFANYIAT
jgi:hypothetical protein